MTKPTKFCCERHHTCSSANRAANVHLSCVCEGDQYELRYMLIPQRCRAEDANVRHLPAASMVRIALGKTTADHSRPRGSHAGEIAGGTYLMMHRCVHYCECSAADSSCIVDVYGTHREDNWFVCLHRGSSFSLASWVPEKKTVIARLGKDGTQRVPTESEETP